MAREKHWKVLSSSRCRGCQDLVRDRVEPEAETGANAVHQGKAREALGAVDDDLDDVEGKADVTDILYAYFALTFEYLKTIYSWRKMKKGWRTPKRSASVCVHKSEVLLSSTPSMVSSSVK